MGKRQAHSSCTVSSCGGDSRDVREKKQAARLSPSLETSLNRQHPFQDAGQSRAEMLCFMWAAMEEIGL